MEANQHGRFVTRLYSLVRRCSVFLDFLVACCEFVYVRGRRGEGALHDKKAETSAEQERNIRHLTESARRIHAARSRGERVR